MKNRNIMVAFQRLGYLAEKKWINEADVEKEINWLALGKGGEAAYAFEGEMTDINRYCGLVMVYDKNGKARCSMYTDSYFGQEFYGECVIARMEYGKYVGLSHEDWDHIEKYRIDPLG